MTIAAWARAPRLLALLAALLHSPGAGAQMMQSPVWTDADTVDVHCFVEPDPSLAIAPFQAALCKRAAELLRARVGGVLKVVEVGIADLALALSSGTVLALIHARAQRADAVVPGAPGLLVTLTARLTRNHSMLRSEAWFSAPPAVVAIGGLDRPAELEPILAKLIADLLARG